MSAAGNRAAIAARQISESNPDPAIDCNWVESGTAAKAESRLQCPNLDRGWPIASEYAKAVRSTSDISESEVLQKPADGVFGEVRVATCRIS